MSDKSSLLGILTFYSLQLDLHYFMFIACVNITNCYYNELKISSNFEINKHHDCEALFQNKKTQKTRKMCVSSPH